ncbi:MAG: transposase [Ardenticatenales bacterium]|nr:transposase [Ardenticatenales bacterium]
MQVRKTFKFKLYRTKKNRYLARALGLAAEIWNHCIALHRRYYRLTGRYLSAHDLKVHLTRLKKRPRYAHWSLLGSQAIQDVVERIDRAYRLFFKLRKAGRRASPPGFKKRHKYRSFTLKQAGWQLLGGNRIRIGQHIYKFAKSREIIGTIKTVTIKRDAVGDWWLFFSVEQEVVLPKGVTTGQMAGFDFGLKQFLTPSEEDPIDSPLFFKQGQKQIAKLNRELARKRPGSTHREQARRRLAAAHRTIADQRRAWFFELAHDLTDQYDYLFFETLNLKGMQKLWGRKVSDLAFGEFLDILRHVAQGKGKVVHQIDRFFPSTKRCGQCKTDNPYLTLADRYWRCPVCGTPHDRERNAAQNIFREGASSLGLGGVRPSHDGSLCLSPESTGF